MNMKPLRLVSPNDLNAKIDMQYYQCFPFSNSSQYNLICNEKSIKNAFPQNHFVTVYGSGNFHHLELEKLRIFSSQNNIENLIVIDGHYEADKISELNCGNWPSIALLRGYAKNLILVGCKDESDSYFAEKSILDKVEVYSHPDNLPEFDSAYLSIDLDSTDMKNDWKFGDLKPENIETVIEKVSIIQGAGICGTYTKRGAIDYIKRAAMYDGPLNTYEILSAFKDLFDKIGNSTKNLFKKTDMERQEEIIKKLSEMIIEKSN